LEKIKELMDSSDDIQEDEVLYLKAQILNSLYSVTADLVVERIIQHGNYMLSVIKDNDSLPEGGR
jgi:hypothetical protein